MRDIARENVYIQIDMYVCVCECVLVRLKERYLYYTTDNIYCQRERGKDQIESMLDSTVLYSTVQNSAAQHIKA